MPTSDTCKRLHDAFHQDTEITKHRMKLLKTQVQDTLKVYSDVLTTVGNNCGFCYLNGQVIVHEGRYCPKLDMHSFNAVMVNVKYTKMPQTPCFKCHIVSGGQDQLHPPFQKGVKCVNANLVVPLLCGIQQSVELRTRVMKELKVEEHKHHWNNEIRLIRWLEDPKATDRPSSSMALVAWLEKELKIVVD